MKRLLIAMWAVFSASACFAQLTQEQRVTDFLAITGLYDKNYAPYEWKLKAFGYDMLNLQPWLAQVNASRTDLDFYDICVRYVASLNDYHDEVYLPAQYEAWLPITADIYDGKVLIDGIDSSVLDPQAYPFNIGDELVSVDGKSTDVWIQALLPYAVNGHGNPTTGSRIATALMLDRLQLWYTFAGTRRRATFRRSSFEAKARWLRTG